VEIPTGVFDNNVIAAAFISRFAKSASILAVNAIRELRVRLAYSEETLHELAVVLQLDHFRREHNKSEAEIRAFCDTLRVVGVKYEPRKQVLVSLARDITDTKFLDLALAADADFLVTNDARHLLRLKQIGQTKILTPHKFLLALNREP